MEKLGFTLDQLLRHTFAGAIAIAVLLIGFDGFRKTPIVNSLGSSEKGATAVVAILVVGSLIYAIHRALPFAVIRWIIARNVWWQDQIPPWKSDHDRTFRMKFKESVYHQYRDWAAQVHFLYCAGWAILIGSGVGRHVLALNPSKYGPTLFNFFVPLLFVSAVVHHWRLEWYERQAELRIQREGGEDTKSTTAEKS